jgi:superfamily II DNA or RNA helicase
MQPVQSLLGIAPQPCLHIRPVKMPDRARLSPLQMDLSFDYAGLRRHWSHPQSPVLEEADGRRVLLHRDLAAELGAIASLRRLGLEGDAQGRHHISTGQPTLVTQWLDWATRDFEPLRAAGFMVTQEAHVADVVQRVAALDFRLTDADGRPLGDDTVDPQAQQHSWFGLSLGMDIDGVRRDALPWLPGILRQLRTTAHGAELPEWIWHAQEDGSYLRIPSAPLKPWVQVLLDLLEGQRPENGVLRVSRLDVIHLGTALGDDTPWAGVASLRSLLPRLGGHAQLPQTPLPRGLQAQLRPYQHRGLDWLQLLAAHGLDGVLADDMGLGKTLQTLAHLLAEKEAGRLDRPALIVAPVSLLGNWRREAARFTPSLSTLVWHGSGRHGTAPELQHADVVIAPYSLLKRDRGLWLGKSWHIVVLDEAQNIKNTSTHAAQIASELDTRHRLCLSGTPLENHLGELWSLFHFLMPGFLGSQASFRQRFRTPIERHGDLEKLGHLRRRVAPFLLRRTKGEVVTELPEKVENITFATLEGPQANLYETIRLATEKTVRAALVSKGLARSQIEFLDALLKLRQVCCDPRLLRTSAWQAGKAPSAKLDLLMELLPEMIAEGRRVLLFSQFTSMLGLIEEELQARGMAWTKLTGQTQQRDVAIERFTSGQVPLFLISLRAGGTGLNLPQADTVIHFDPWWNPAVEEQATARAHRIGQTSKVFVYKLVAQGTIEERILALQARKAELAQSLLHGTAARREALFTEEDLAELLKPLE